MVNAEASLSPTPQSFRQRFPHLIPRADDLVPSTLPKLKEVLGVAEHAACARTCEFGSPCILFCSE
jgi:hypothetical protein